MANIYTSVDVDLDVDAQDWFDNSIEDERKDMYEICKEHFEGIKPNSMSLPEAEFHNKLSELRKRYVTLTKEQYNLIMSI